METYNDYDPYRFPRIKVSGPLAMAYVPMQKFKNLYTPAQGYPLGTSFQDLDFPWVGRDEK